MQEPEENRISIYMVIEILCNYIHGVKNEKTMIRSMLTCHRDESFYSWCRPNFYQI
jgi:hypothetical protein